jgi:hypothetical protein
MLKDLKDPVVGLELLAESLDWRLFEIVEWRNGSNEPRSDMIDWSLESGQIRSL